MAQFDLQEMEERWRRFWDDQGVYRYDPSRGRDETFVVDTPPPTVSGSLHIGHVCSFTHTDLMVRYRRMRGDNIFYPMGWDDNGLPTERRVQNVFNVRCDPSLPYEAGLEVAFGREGETIAVSRRNFIELCDQVVSEDEKKFKDLFRRVGLSVDWEQSYATIDERSRYVSQLSFLHLLEKKEVELRNAPTMWDVGFQSAVAQAEVEDRDRDGFFYRIRFGVEGAGGEPTGDESFVIATTRPELLPACIAVTAHPEDERYRHLIGRTALTPLFHAPVPIIADEGADPAKGTGILMICTFGDQADVEWWRELNVPAREVIARDGRILPAPWGDAQWQSRDPDKAARNHDQLAGLTIAQAQRAVVEMLQSAGDLEGEPERVRRPVKFYEKGDRPLEFVVSRQWFVPVMDKKDKLLEQGRRIEWHPELFRKRYEDWVEGLNQDWCISRQRYFGVPIPVWYEIDETGAVNYEKLIVPEKDDLPVDPYAETPTGYSAEQRGRPGGFTGDPDIFDTWATSALTPLIASGWPDDLVRHEALYPNDLRPQAHDIIRTWAFVTITRAFLEDGSIPWKHAAISGFVLDPLRKKMSKSKGNVTLPTEPLDQFGADATRYWAASSRLGVDTAIDNNVFKEGKRLVTKIRNAARLVRLYEGAGGAPTHPLDVALRARLSDVIAAADVEWEAWDHAGALEVIESWFWSDFCDNYLELSKSRAYAGDPSALATLRTGLDIVLRLFAPFLPYITEEVWNADREAPRSIHKQAWPSRDELLGAKDAGLFDVAVEVLTQVRRAKSQAKVSIRFPVERLEIEASQATLELLEPVMDDVSSTLAAESYELRASSDESITTQITLGQAPSKGT